MRPNIPPKIAALMFQAAVLAVMVGQTPIVSAQQSQVIASGAGGAFTVDAANAYIEAALFVHRQIGQPIFPTPSSQEVAQHRASLARAFPMMTYETQVDLVNARAIWNSYAQRWAALSLEDKRDFAFEVLAIAYGGEQAAAMVYGAPARNPGRSGSLPVGTSGTTPSFSYGDIPTVNPDTGNVIQGGIE